MYTYLRPTDLNPFCIIIIFPAFGVLPRARVPDVIFYNVRPFWFSVLGKPSGLKTTEFNLINILYTTGTSYLYIIVHNKIYLVRGNITEKRSFLSRRDRGRYRVVRNIFCNGLVGVWNDFTPSTQKHISGNIIRLCIHEQGRVRSDLSLLCIVLKYLYLSDGNAGFRTFRKTVL